MMLDSEAGWKSVDEHFPADKRYRLPAKQGLARCICKELDFRRALAIFDEFAGMSNVEQDYKAFGLAGQAVVLNRLGKYRESAAKLALLWPLRNRLDGEMRALVQLTCPAKSARAGRIAVVATMGRVVREIRRRRSSPSGRRGGQPKPRRAVT